MVPNYVSQTVLMVEIIILGPIVEIEKCADSAPPMRNSKNLKYDKKIRAKIITKSVIYWRFTYILALLSS